MSIPKNPAPWGILTISPCRADYLKTKQLWLDHDWSKYFQKYVLVEEHPESNIHMHINYLEKEAFSALKYESRQKQVRTDVENIRGMCVNSCLKECPKWKMGDLDKKQSFEGGVSYCLKDGPALKYHGITSEEMEACKISHPWVKPILEQGKKQKMNMAMYFYEAVNIAEEIIVRKRELIDEDEKDNTALNRIWKELVIRDIITFSNANIEFNTIRKAIVKANSRHPEFRKNKTKHVYNPDGSVDYEKTYGNDPDWQKNKEDLNNP